MPSKLSLYNGALNVLGERNLASLTENREPRHKLDDIYDNDMIDRVLQHGQWKFAKRTAQLQASTTITPEFGYQFAYELPTDFIRTLGVASDEFFIQPLTQYDKEGATLFCEIETLYLMYVSNDSQFGNDLSLWPGNFTEYVEFYMARKVAPTLTGLDYSDTELKKQVAGALTDAKATDAMEAPTKFPPKGNWASSRQGFATGERGKRNQLIG